MIIKVNKEGVGQRSVGIQKKVNYLYRMHLCYLHYRESSNLPILKLPNLQNDISFHSTMSWVQIKFSEFWSRDPLRTCP